MAQGSGICVSNLSRLFLPAFLAAPLLRSACPPTLPYPTPTNFQTASTLTSVSMPLSSRPPTTIVATPARKLCTHHLEKRCARLRSRILGTWCSLEGEMGGRRPLGHGTALREKGGDKRERGEWGKVEKKSVEKRERSGGEKGGNAGGERGEGAVRGGEREEIEGVQAWHGTEQPTCRECGVCYNVYASALSSPHSQRSSRRSV